MDHHDDAQLLSELSTTLHDELDESATVATIFEQARFLLPDASHIGITIRARRGTYRSAGVSTPLAAEADRLQYELDEGPCLSAAAKGGEGWLRVGDIANDERWPTWGPRAAAVGVRSMLSVQWLSRDTSFGAINIYSEQLEKFTDTEDVDRALLWSAHAASALASAQTESGLHTAVSARHTMGLAQGILMQRYDIDENQAFQLLTRVSSQREEKMRDIAQYIVANRELPTG